MLWNILKAVSHTAGIFAYLSLSHIMVEQVNLANMLNKHVELARSPKHSCLGFGNNSKIKQRYLRWVADRWDESQGSWL